MEAMDQSRGLVITAAVMKYCSDGSSSDAVIISTLAGFGFLGH